MRHWAVYISRAWGHFLTLDSLAGGAAPGFARGPRPCLAEDNPGAGASSRACTRRPLGDGKINEATYKSAEPVWFGRDAWGVIATPGVISLLPSRRWEQELKSHATCPAQWAPALCPLACRFPYAKHRRLAAARGSSSAEFLVVDCLEHNTLWLERRGLGVGGIAGGAHRVPGAYNTLWLKGLVRSVSRSLGLGRLRQILIPTAQVNGAKA